MYKHFVLIELARLIKNTVPLDILTFIDDVSFNPLLL